MDSNCVVDIRGLKYAYPAYMKNAEPVNVLKGIDLQVKRGEFLSIMGPVGSGKTTLCLALNGIVPHSSGGSFGGNVVVCGINTKQSSIAELAKKTGIVFQDPESQLFCMTVADEVAFGLENRGMPPPEMACRISESLALVGMSAFAERSPVHLSGGQKQRVAIAAILAMEPEVLVLDEPTSGLDPMGKREVFTVVDRLRNEKAMTIIMIEHEAEQIARFSDRVVVLDNGRIALQGTPGEIFSKTETLSAIGVAVPQMAELSQGLRRQNYPGCDFITLDGALRYFGENAWMPADSASKFAAESPAVPAALSVAPSAAPVIEARQVYFHYEGDRHTLRNINGMIFDGEFVGIIGQNGSGKSTLVKHFNGLLKPQAGTVYVNGRDTKTQSLSEIAGTVGFVFQNPDHQIFCPTVAEELAFGPANLGLSKAATAERVQDALARFNLTRWADHPPAILGFGIRRKVSLAAIYAMRQRVLILDEPTMGLDRKSAMELLDIIVSLNQQGHTILLISHDMRIIAEFTRRSILLLDGAIAADGPTREVLSDFALLEKTQILPPEIVRLSATVIGRGLTEPVFSNGEFIEKYRKEGR
ncbi:cobalt ABC transporter ATP-binding protein [Spirochaetia bacterium]|nr:cobalt ABC transporter ATP-binding protein [Spirochaetia bacterium]